MVLAPPGREWRQHSEGPELAFVRVRPKGALRTAVAVGAHSSALDFIRVGYRDGIAFASSWP